MITSRVLSMLGELTLVYLTWAKTRKVYLLGMRTGIKTPLVTLLLRDGALYFGWVLLSHL